MSMCFIGKLGGETMTFRTASGILAATIAAVALTLPTAAFAQ